MEEKKNTATAYYSTKKKNKNNDTKRMSLDWIRALNLAKEKKKNSIGMNIETMNAAQWKWQKFDCQNSKKSNYFLLICCCCLIFADFLSFVRSFSHLLFLRSLLDIFGSVWFLNFFFFYFSIELMRTFCCKSNLLCHIDDIEWEVRARTHVQAQNRIRSRRRSKLAIKYNYV